MQTTRDEVLRHIAVYASDALECQLAYRGWTVNTSLYDESSGARWRNVRFFASDQRLEGEKERTGALSPLTQLERDTLKEQALKLMTPYWKERGHKHFESAGQLVLES